MRRVLSAVLIAMMAVGTVGVALLLNGNPHPMWWRLCVLGAFIVWEVIVLWLALLVYDNLARRGVHRR
jgi:hypothetical protein